MELRIIKAMKETEEEQRKGKIIRRGWWDEECEDKKRGVREELRRWRKNREDKER